MNQQEFLSRSNTGIVVVDMQLEWVRNLDNKKDLINNQIKIIKQNPSLPAILLEMNPPKYGKTLYLIRESVRDRLEARIDKDNTDGFTNPNLEETLYRFGIKNILFMGTYASACVFSTSRSAIDKGFKIGTNQRLIADMSCDSHTTISKGAFKWYQQNCDYFE
ncbi:isochorismatase family protein [archaeon]|jgi:hypothetical protein|nr:isochorismatase family protein [archaeon]MBT4373491.1 isochorismatase family protein [archaeon]MBT4531939.1 isochorismatase family protein [archaeon]MBT7001606.1 isochorismatase family protein [archaeon]MBT7282502.1 isochorismatase family protein [archaeon]